MAKFFLFFALSFGLISCHPSVYQLKQFENASGLQADTLFVVMNRDIEDLDLLIEYNQTKKIKKLQEKLDNQNQYLMQAFDEYFTFAPVVYWYLEEQQNSLPNGYYTQIARDYEYSGEGAIPEEYLYLHVYNADDVKVATTSTSFTSWKSGFRSVVKQMNNRLKYLHEKGEKLKSQKESE